MEELSREGDPLEKLAATVDLEMFRPVLQRVLRQAAEDRLLFEDDEGERLHVHRLFIDSVFEAPLFGVHKGMPDGSVSMQGWWSPLHLELEPCTSLALRAEGAYVTMATLFSFSPVEVDHAFSCFNASRRALRFAWRTPQGGHVRLRLLRSRRKTGKAFLSIELQQAQGEGDDTGK